MSPVDLWCIDKSLIAYLPFGVMAVVPFQIGTCGQDGDRHRPCRQLSGLRRAEMLPMSMCYPTAFGPHLGLTGFFLVRTTGLAKTIQP